MDQQTLSWVQFCVSIIGSGLGTTGVGLLFKRKFDRDLEIHKAFLTRAANVHGRMVNTLAALYRHFWDAQACFQGMTAAARFTGEPSRQEYEAKFANSMEAARDTLMQGRLFIPQRLAEQCDSFFKAVFGGRLDYSFAQNPMIDGDQKTELWEAAKRSANQELPKILQGIEEAARAVIHG
jgi:hypothetical protein